jgi:hypothetical protein
MDIVRWLRRVSNRPILQMLGDVGHSVPALSVSNMAVARYRVVNWPISRALKCCR